MIALLLWKKQKIHLLLLSSPLSLDGDVESGLWCCCCQFALCHTHPLPLFHWADSSGRQSRSRVAEYQCRGIMHILQVKEFQNARGLPAIPWNTKGTKMIPWAAYVFHLASAFFCTWKSHQTPNKHFKLRGLLSSQWHSSFFPSADVRPSQAVQLLMAAVLKSSLENQSD